MAECCLSISDVDIFGTWITLRDEGDAWIRMVKYSQSDKIIIIIITTNGPGCIEVKTCDQLRVPNSPPNLAPVDDTWIRIKADMKEKPITLKLVVLIKRPHFIWANS